LRAGRRTVGLTGMPRSVAPLGPDSPWTRESARLCEARDDKRESVLYAAAIAFARRGVDGTSMDELAAAVGVTKPTIYRTVGDKEAIVRACEARMIGYFREALAQAQAMHGTGLQKGARYLRLSLHLMVHDVYCRLNLPLGGPDMYAGSSEELRAMREEAQCQVRSWLRADQLAGTLHPDVDTRLTALALFAAFNFIPRWYREDGSQALEEIFDATMRVFERGLVVDAPALAPIARGRISAAKRNQSRSGNAAD